LRKRELKKCLFFATCQVIPTCGGEKCEKKWCVVISSLQSERMSSNICVMTNCFF